MITENSQCLTPTSAGTGSMLFSLTIGLISVLCFGARKLHMKVKYRISGRAIDTKKKDIVIYSEDKRYWTTFKGILDEFEKRKVKVTYLAGSEDDPLLKEDYKYVETEVIGLGNKAYAKLNFLNSRIVLATTPGLDVYQWKRSKDVDWYVHITHAIGAGTAYRMFGTQFYDALLLSSDQFIPLHRRLEEKRESEKKEIEIVGQTYMDYLWNRKSSRCNEGDEKTTVLLAPSWGSSSILNRFGAKIIDCLISTGYYIIIRPHPQSFISEKEMILELMEQYPETDLLKWNLDSDNFEVLQNASILISDYSGILYDYAFVFDRPVIYTDVSLDLTCTDHAFLEEELWIYPVLRKIGKELKEIEIPKIKSFIDSLINSKEMQKYISEARESCWQYRGLAAERVVDYLLKKDEELKEAGGVDDKG